MENTALVLGSIAFDYIMKFDGKFKDVILPDADQNLTGSFNVSSLRVRFGGTAGNISYNLALLGVKAIAVSSTGDDFVAMKYDEHLRKVGVDLKLVGHPEEHTAAAYIVSDAANNQLTVFHPGALKHAGKISIKESVGNVIDRVKIAIIAPNPVDAFVNYSRELGKLKIPFIFDPGQVTPGFTPEQLMKIIPNSKLLIANTHEIELVKRKLNLSVEELVKKVPNIIVTEGAKGSTILGEGYAKHIPVAKPKVFRDPTGAGDGYRAGLMWGLLNSLSLEDSAKVGAIVGSFVVEGDGPQDHTFTTKEVRERYEATFDQVLKLPRQ
ncbi:MAG: carbohydrate kinase family protein [Promethearchaeati archaeon SRVP18_Atabeyarchaeia-1]